MRRWGWMVTNEWMLVDERGWTDRIESIKPDEWNWTATNGNVDKIVTNDDIDETTTNDDIDEIVTNDNGWRWTTMNGDYADDGTTEWSTSTSFTTMVCKREFFFFSFFFFFQSYYKGNSLYDYKLKNTHECTTQMLTSKPMYKESTCTWGCITGCRSCIVIKPCVCVYMVLRPKASSKTSFGDARSFLPSKLWNSKLHSL
jgi:hypothetical protein